MRTRTHFHAVGLSDNQRSRTTAEPPERRSPVQTLARWFSDVEDTLQRLLGDCFSTEFYFQKAYTELANLFVEFDRIAWFTLHSYMSEKENSDFVKRIN